MFSSSTLRSALIGALAIGVGPLVACKSEVGRKCDAFNERMLACAGPGRAGVERANVLEYCVVTESDDLPRTPLGASPTLADVSRAALEACMATTTCDTLHACLTAQRCLITVRSPTDLSPSFACYGK